MIPLLPFSLPHELGLGWRTTALGLAALHCLVIGGALMLDGRGNRVASRRLGLALWVIAGMLAPYALGFAGFYDAFRGLTFIPLAAPLALGPLLLFYGEALTGRPASRAAGLHLGPALVQGLYMTLCFALPATAKWDWYTGGHRLWVSPVFDALIPISLLTYTALTARALARFRVQLADQRSDDDRFAARWLAQVLGALGAGALLEIAFWTWSLLAGGINFFEETGLYLGLGLLGVYLGVEGWRHAALPAPLEPLPSAPETRSSADWTAFGAELEAQVRREGWWKEPDLTLPRLARLAGTNTGRISRAANLGLGVNFSAFINGLRAEAVADALRSGRKDDLLDLAMEMGFASKASFNRVFRDRFGMSPSAYRRRVSDPDFLVAGPDLGRTPDAISPD